MIVITGATGQLGRLVIGNLLRTVPASRIVAAVRNPAKAADLSASGVQVRHADYSERASLTSALAGAKKLLLISSSEVGQRVVQHRAVIDVAVRAGVELLVYTSVLNADKSPLGLAHEHRETESLLKASGLRHALLRNGWYTENYAASIPAALTHGQLLGSAGEGLIASAARADYAAAAAAVLTLDDQAGRVYELAGDASYTLAEFAAEIARQAGRPVTYKNLSQAEYESALVSVGQPAPIADLIADSDAGASKGGLFDDGRQLGKLIGRPTTSMAESIAAAIKNANASGLESKP